MQWLCLTRGRASQTKTFSDGRFWARVFRRWHESGAAFRQLDATAGEPSPIFQEWLAHPEQGPYWDRYNPSTQEYADIHLPVLTITGSYDDDQLGALAHYREHTRWASPEIQEKHHLVIGPWNHAGTATAAAEAGGVPFGPMSRLDLPKLHRDWYAWTLEGGPKPEFLKQRVAYYVMGANRWRYAETLEAATSRHVQYFLASAGGARSVFASGELTTTPAEGLCDQFTYDPRELNGPEIDAEACADGGSLTDQSLLLALSGRALVYHSASFSSDTEITGFFRLTAWIAIDRPDTDLYVSVHEITASGGSIRLSTDAIRARYRADLRTPKLVETREPQAYEFDRFTFVSRQIAKGHRLRLIIAPLGRLIDSTFVQKNYNGGGFVADETVEEAHAVTVRLFHDRTRPSALHVPLGRPVSLEEPGAPLTVLLECWGDTLE